MTRANTLQAISISRAYHPLLAYLPERRCVETNWITGAALTLISPTEIWNTIPRNEQTREDNCCNQATTLIENWPTESMSEMGMLQQQSAYSIPSAPSPARF
jgi:hypothetical protein